MNMLDLTTDKGKIVDAALRLATSEGWSGLGLDRIAAAAGLGLNDLRGAFASKSQILVAYTRAVDDAVLAKVSPADAGVAARDRLFDVLMTRFELMQPHKAGLRRIAADLRAHPGEGLAQLGVAARSLYWMLAAAGIDAEGARGAWRIPGLMAVYARVFDIWLDDDDPGLARTMAALDSRLRRGERVIQRMDDIGAAAVRVCSGLFAAMRGKRDGETPPGGDDMGHAPSGNGRANGSAGPGTAPAI
jgi:AcrR family transcriptional regulator